MAVAFDAASTAYVTNSTSVTVALTVANNACLLVMCQLKGAAGLSVSAVYANGTQMTQIARVESGGTSPINNHIFALTASPSGTVSISADIVGATGRGMGIAAISFTGQRTDSNPFSAIAKVTAGAQANINLSVSTSTTDMCVLFGGGTNSLQSNCTVRASNASNWGFYLATTAGTINGASGFSASISMSFGANYVHCSMLLNVAAVRATATVFQYSRMMKGIGY